jgi:delta 1-pyrroline-5-carboxylate dehydrogenase
VRERRDVLRRIADIVRRDQESLAELESTNTGKPISAARGEVGAVAEAFDYYAGTTDKFTGQSKGFGFVEMPNNSEADAAIKALNETALKGRNIKVNQAKPRGERPARGGGGGRRY